MAEDNKAEVAPSEPAAASNLVAIKAGEFRFTREDAIRLCRDWQDYEWGVKHRHTADNIENAIEELCLAFGFTVEEVRATWWSRRKPDASAGSDGETNS